MKKLTHKQLLKVTKEVREKVSNLSREQKKELFEKGMEIINVESSNKKSSI